MSLTNFPNGISSFGVPLFGGGVPFGQKSKVFFVDPTNGNDGYTGASPDQAFKNVATAYALTTSGNNDVIFFIAGATSTQPTAGITWSNSYTHLIAVGNDLPGMGARARIVNSASNDLATLMTVSGSGCLFSGIQWFDGKDSAADGACLLVSGNNNHFVNCQIAGMGDATASGPATRAGSYSLKVSGEQNTFTRCTVGLDTVLRSAANSELIVSGPRNRFIDCDFRSNCVTAGKFLVKIDNSTADLRDTLFENPVFFNYTENWANGIDNVFDMPAGGNTHFVIIKGIPVLVGVNSGWADTVTRVYSAAPAPNAGWGLGTAPTT